MREVVVDTETTGLDPDTGDRIVEIGAVELMGHVPTGRTFHEYINPERSMPQEAFEVHGLGDDFLRGKPVFSAVGKHFLEFVGTAKLVIHNAAFDMKFLNAELGWMGLDQIPADQALDTLAIARRRYPGAPASLDALCRRFGIDLSVRTQHGALLDSELLAEVYLELIGGRQPGFGLTAANESEGSTEDAGPWRPRPRPNPLPPRVSEEEIAAHRAFVEAMGKAALWSKGSGG